MDLDSPAGFIVIIICGLGYYLSWTSKNKNNYFVAIVLLFLSGLFLRLYCSCDFYLHNWDEKYHALVAKNLIHHPFIPTLYDNALLDYDYKNWTSNHIWLHKPPFPLWSMAFSMWLFGCNEIALRLPSVILSSLGIFLTFSIGKYFFSKYVGYIAAFLYSINGLIIELSSGRVATDHIDTFFLFFIMSGIFFTIKFSEKRNYYLNLLAGLSMGIAILCKWFPALIIIPIWLLIMIEGKGLSLKQLIADFFIFILSAIAVFAPWEIYIYSNFPLEATWENSYNTRHLFEPIEEHSGSVFYFINKIRINYNELIYLPLIWLLVLIYQNVNNIKFWILFIWIFIPLIIFSLAQTKMQGYIVFTAPALFIITGAFIEFLFTKNSKIKYSKYLSIIPYAIIILAIRYSLERIKPFSNKDRSPIEIGELKKLNNQYKNAILFNYQDPITAMFYTNMIAYPFIPTDSIINNLKQKGFNIFINEPVDHSLFNNNNITYLNYSYLKQ
jgi:4-amino-4-deoxy-L-arabinose transferase-like glycosyltransferase